MNNNKLQVVGAVLIKNNKVLLPKRSANLKKMPNKYEFPGGKVEKGESLKEGLKRELKEELSIDVNIEDIIDFPKNVLTTDKFDLTIFTIEKWKNELTINPEINSSILEVTLEQLKNVEGLLDTDKELIPSIIAFLK
jgi:8-oxo-dGTP diphosphatase